MKKNFTKKVAIKVLSTEIKSLKKLYSVINSDFVNAVNKIYKCDGKVICIGVGKSGHILKKISSTFCSVGIPSYFLSPVDASHGDLGIINKKKDIFLIMSYSGNTEELKNVIDFSRKFKIFVIGITSNKNSTLFKSSKIKIILPKVKEAGLDIVPTSSTTSQLVIGDALAICSMKKKKFTKKDFYQLHPAGQLGKMLTEVKDIMISGEEVPTIKHTLKVKDAIIKITQKTIGLVLVINDKKKVIGILTDGDVRRLINKKNFLNINIKKVMTKQPLAIPEDMLAMEALKIMNKKRVTSLVVKTKNKTISLIHIHNLLGFNA